MCGICGFIGRKENKEEILERMMTAMRHRGPDSEGKYCTEQAAFGFCRLSIIDLEDGAQPMMNEDDSKALVFNGEIYNYKSLREELAAKGHSFKTHSDSETLIHGYESYGKELLDRIRGMFAFAVWDEEKEELFAARDFFGIKPFYYAEIGGCFVFSSEIKSILKFPGFEKQLNREALEHYLSFQYSILPETFFKGIYRLLPGSGLTYRNKDLRIFHYFDPMLEPEKMGTEEEIINRLDRAVKDSVKYHMESDVEIGAFLSSGVDSSLIASEFTGSKAFTVGFFDEQSRYNETSQAKKLAKHLGLVHHSKEILQEEYWDAVPKVMYHLDEPSGDPSAIALYFVAQEASKHVKVVTSGEGADELFGGYNIYLEPKALGWFTVLPNGIRKGIGRLAAKLPKNMKGRNYLIRGSKSLEERFIGNANIFSASERRDLLKHAAGAASPQELLKEKYEKTAHLSDVDKMQYIDLTCWLPGDILQKADRMSMAHSLELRVPFLDREVFELSKRLPRKARVHGKTTKYLFRCMAARHLPKESSQKKKLGFPVPIRVWLREEGGYNKVKQRFTSPAAEQYFQTDRLVTLLEEHKNGGTDNSRKIWTVYAFLVWHQVFMEG